MPVFPIEALGIERQSLATKNFVFGFHYVTIDGEGTLSQPTSQFGAGIVRQQRSSGLIDALACQRSRNIDFFVNARRLLITHNGCNPTEFGKNSDFVGHTLLHGQMSIVRRRALSFSQAERLYLVPLQRPLVAPPALSSA